MPPPGVWGLAAACLLLLPAIAPAAKTDDAKAAAEAARVMSRLDRKLDSLRTLRGRFVQTFTSSGLGIPQAEEGTFAMERPDLLRWDYSKPERKLAVSDGKSTWLYMPDQKIVYKGTVSDWMNGGAFSVLAGGHLAAAFDPIEASAQGVEISGDVRLRLRPKEHRDQYEYLLIEFEPASLLIHSITAVDGMGNRVAVHLSRMEQNPDLPGSLFRFVPPAGVQVVDQAPAVPRTPSDAAGRPLR